MIKQKVYLLLENLNLLRHFWFCSSTVTFGSYLFQLVVLLKADFNCSSSFALFELIKLQMKQSFVSVIVNIGTSSSIGLSIIKHLLEQDKLE